MLNDDLYCLLAKLLVSGKNCKIYKIDSTKQSIADIQERAAAMDIKGIFIEHTIESKHLLRSDCSATELSKALQVDCESIEWSDLLASMIEKPRQNIFQFSSDIPSYWSSDHLTSFHAKEGLSLLANSSADQTSPSVHIALDGCLPMLVLTVADFILQEELQCYLESRRCRLSLFMRLPSHEEQQGSAYLVDFLDRSVRKEVFDNLNSSPFTCIWKLCLRNMSDEESSAAPLNSNQTSTDCLYIDACKLLKLMSEGTHKTLTKQLLNDHQESINDNPCSFTDAQQALHSSSKHFASNNGLILESTEKDEDEIFSSNVLSPGHLLPTPPRSMSNGINAITIRTDGLKSQATKWYALSQPSNSDSRQSISLYSTSLALPSEPLNNDSAIISSDQETSSSLPMDSTAKVLDHSTSYPSNTYISALSNFNQQHPQQLHRRFHTQPSMDYHSIREPFIPSSMNNRAESSIPNSMNNAAESFTLHNINNRIESLVPNSMNNGYESLLQHSMNNTAEPLTRNTLNNGHESFTQNTLNDGHESNATVSVTPYILPTTSTQPLLSFHPAVIDRLAINLDDIRSGANRMTTCMIRNIPNKYTQQMLLALINETHFGLYDFFYLRMDFKNRCNVGYAFINFTDHRHIISFYQRLAGKRWARFNSEKICEISYAKIQGRTALIEKFRNSTVMNEPEGFRPKLFHTDGFLMGMEMDFPESMGYGMLTNGSGYSLHSSHFTPQSDYSIHDDD